MRTYQPPASFKLPPSLSRPVSRRTAAATPPSLHDVQMVGGALFIPIAALAVVLVGSGFIN